jgi:MFS transporter, DHA2 family, multidrug resistance protein
MIEAVLAGLGIYLFLVHMFTTERPFIPLALFRDRYFTMATLLMFLTNTIMMASSALLAPYLQNLSGYPVATAGTLMAPRGIGTMVAMVFIGRFGSRVDQRRLMFIGLTTLGLTLHDMSTWTPDISAAHLVTVLVIQGFAMGWVWNPITLISFTTLPASLRGDATALQSLMRNVGSAIGISVTAFTLARGVQISHSGLTADLTPFNRLLQGQWSVPKILAPWTTHGAELLDSMVNRQALIIAYNNDFHLMSFVVIPALLLLVLVRRHRAQPAGGPVVVAD